MNEDNIDVGRDFGRHDFVIDERSVAEYCDAVDDHNAIYTGPSPFGGAVAPLYGLRWPENAHAENLVATAWIENADGRITQVATDRCADPR